MPTIDDKIEALTQAIQRGLDKTTEPCPRVTALQERVARVESRADDAFNMASRAHKSATDLDAKLSQGLAALGMELGKRLDGQDGEIRSIKSETTKQSATLGEQTVTMREVKEYTIRQDASLKTIGKGLAVGLPLLAIVIGALIWLIRAVVPIPAPPIAPPGAHLAP